MEGFFYLIPNFLCAKQERISSVLLNPDILNAHLGVSNVPEADLRHLDPGYCLFAVQRPLQPSARLYEPLPLLPDILPVAVGATPSALMLAER
jgi:hypothetical protein